MKLIFGLFFRIFLGLLAAMGLVRVLEMDKSPAALLGLTLLATIAVYGAGWLLPKDSPKPGREDLPS